jgi:hypothetical protein
MEPQRSGDLEVWRLWRYGGEVWRSGGCVGMEVWRACKYGGLEGVQACRLIKGYSLRREELFVYKSFRY